jgi:hypothetical protein
MMNNRIKIGLICGAAGYLLSEYFTLRRAYKLAGSVINPSIRRYRYKWAVQMVLNEYNRGKYNDCVSKEDIQAKMDADLEYYNEVANILNIKGST